VVKRRKKISIVIPAYNEEKTIARVIKAVVDVPLKNLVKEVIVVNDGSTDGTGEELIKLKKKYGFLRFINKKNGGKGSALRAGIAAATGRIVIPQDADLELNPDNYEKLITPILAGKSKVVFGYRNWWNAKIPIHSKIANFAVTFLANFLYGAKIKDEACGFKVMTRSLYQSLNLKSNGFEICPETLAKVRKLGYKIRSVPVSFSPRKFSEGKKIKFKDGLWAIYSLIRFRLIV
jgi:dolichol-phosphate mannosyltransferase